LKEEKCKGNGGGGWRGYRGEREKKEKRGRGKEKVFSRFSEEGGLVEHTRADRSEPKCRLRGRKKRGRRSGKCGKKLALIWEHWPKCGEEGGGGRGERDQFGVTKRKKRWSESHQKKETSRGGKMLRKGGFENLRVVHVKGEPASAVRYDEAGRDLSGNSGEGQSRIPKRMLRQTREHDYGENYGSTQEGWG